MASASETGVSHFSPDMSATSPRPGGSRSRTQSISSDKPSTIAQGIMSPPISVSPEAAFIAASAASQIVTNDHDGHADLWYDQHGYHSSGETLLVSGAALRQLNNFLDHLLFNFLAAAGSTALPNLRPAVTEILKPKLAKDAINNADEELREYLGGGDDEEFLQSPSMGASRGWDVELVWKRTRLRCMVYSSLGDMEEEEEDLHMEEGFLGGDEEVPDSNVSPAVAIFLTSILEYLGEQALVAAGQAAWNRTRIKYEKEIRDGVKRSSDVLDRIIVEEVDMERVALDRTLGRLWRAWKKRLRSGPGSVDLSNRPASRDKNYPFRRPSLPTTSDGLAPAAVKESNERESAVEESRDMDDGERAASIPLPMGIKDVDEIEVPGLVYYSDEELDEDQEEVWDLGIRPKSLMIFSSAVKTTDLPTDVAAPQTPTLPTRKRANSLPTPAASPLQTRKADTTTPEAVEAQNLDAEASPLPNVTVDEAPNAEHVDTNNNIDGADPQHARHSIGFRDLDGGAAAAAAAAAASPSPVIGASKQLGSAADEEDDSDFEEIEEAQILTTSRISIGGSLSARSDSPANSDHSSRPSLSLHTLPVRTGSLRVVDVTHPRTPSTRSQRSSVNQEANSNSYSRSASRTSSVQTQSNVDEQRDFEDSRDLRAAAMTSAAKARGHAAQPISEAVETEELTKAQADREPSPVNEGKITQIAAAPESKKYRRQPTQPIFGSVKRQSPVSPQHSPTTYPEQFQSQPSPRAIGTSISTPPLTTPPDSGTFMEDSIGPLPQRYPRQSPRQYGSPASPNTAGPAVPEKSSHRKQQSANGQPGSIGVVSVDRSGGYADAVEAKSPLDQNATRSAIVHTPVSSTSSQKLRATRGSQDSTATRPEDVARHFEELIQSNETIQYTLTPENMRGLENSPRSVHSPMQSAFQRDRAGSSGVKPVEVRRSTSVNRATGLRSHPVELQAGDPIEAIAPLQSTASRNRMIPQHAQARDARIPRESVLEFAEFIRATGPPGSAEVQPVRSNIGLRRNQSLREGGLPPPPPISKTSIDQVRPSLSGSISRARLQAREAIVETTGDNSDLIDFIRRGPPNNAGNPRIPRTVAPFRTTMDSDQMVTAVGGRAMDAQLADHDMRYSQGSTNVTEMSAPSIQSSVNSQSALLGRKQPVAQSSGTFDEPDMMPVRKQRRVRDPYAIDVSDEEDGDDFEEYQPQPTRRAPPKEESLIDFLKNAPPPPSSEPVPFNFARTQSMPVNNGVGPKKKASAPGLMSRFRQNSNAGTGMRSPKSPKSPTANGRFASSRPEPPANKGYIPIQVNIPTGGDLFPSYGGTGSVTPTMSNLPPQFSGRPSGRVPMKKFEPRDAVSVPSRGTSDLADFLRSSEPPPSVTATAWSQDQEQQAGNPSKLFGRRKKSSGFA